MNIDIDLKKYVKKLREQIDDLRYRYHVLNDPEVSDKMYEGLMAELRKIEEENPGLYSVDSPTQRVAGQPLAEFHKVKHSVSQWSFADAFDEDDLMVWEERNLKILEKFLGSRPSDLNYACELKIDGLHVVLTYEKGQLKLAATRGDGKVGEDVTVNIKTIHSVPLKLKEAVDLIAEGEVWMGRDVLSKINKERAKQGEILFANPRNAAAGTIRQLDPKIVAARKLSVTVYDISGGELPETQENELKRLAELGFLTDKNWKICRTVAEIMKFYGVWQKKRESQQFWIDGLVIKINQRKYQDILGYTGKSPRWGIALKFSAEQGTTRIKEIYVQVGRTGALTPVALMDPVKLAGTTVTHATLHNFAEIKRLGVKIGDMVVVEKAGDIIPKVVRVLEKMRTGKEKIVHEPVKCPICGGAVERRKILDRKQNESAALYCANKNCYAKELEKLIHFVSKKAFDIDGLGQKIVEQLVNVGLIKNPADIFTLTKGDLEPLERFAEKSADNLIQSITKSRQITLARFIFGLGINHVGEETAIRLANHFGNLEKLMKTSVENLAEVPDVGERVAESIINFFADKKNIGLIESLLANGVKIESQRRKSQITDLKLKGKSFVFTGGMEKLSRDEAKNKVRELGGDVSGSVSKNTSYVVAGSEPGSKYDKAKQLGVKIISEKEFLDLIKL